MPKPRARIIALWSWGASMWRNQDYESVHARPAATPLVLLPRATRTRIVPPDLGSIAPWLGREGRACIGLPMRPEILIPPQQPSRHVHDDFFALLRADRLGTHLRVLVVLVAEHHHRDQASAVLVVVDKVSPAVVAHAHAPHEAASPVVALGNAVLVLQQERHVDLTLEQRPGDAVPVPHHQSQDFVCLVEARKFVGV